MAIGEMLHLTNSKIRVVICPRFSTFRNCGNHDIPEHLCSQSVLMFVVCLNCRSGTCCRNGTVFYSLHRSSAYFLHVCFHAVR